jgi:hypothetical protein
MSLTDWELWACANHVLSTHGDDAQLYIAKQISTLDARGDEAGVSTWQEIGRRLEFLAAGEEAPGTRH